MSGCGQQSSNNNRIYPRNRKTNLFTTSLLFLLLHYNVNARIHQKREEQRSLQVLDVQSYNIELTLWLKYVSEDIAKTLYRNNKKNTLVHEFCSLINEQVGQIGQIMALNDGITLFTRSDYEFPRTGCEIGKVKYPIPSWDVVDGNMGVEISMSQRVFASKGATDEEVVEYVQNGFRNSELFLPLLKDIISTVDEMEVIDGFSSPFSAPTMPPSFISDTPSLSPTLKSSNFGFQWNVTKYYNNPPRLNDNPETQPPLNNIISELDVISTNRSSSVTSATIGTSKQTPDSYTLPVAYIAAIAASTSAVVLLVLFLLYFFTRKNNAKKKREEQRTEQPVQTVKKQPTSVPKAALLPKVPSFIDIEESQSGDESTIGDHTAGRKPEKKVNTLPTIKSDSQHSQSFQKQRRPISLNVDYEDDHMYPNRPVHTPGTASPSLSSSSRVTPRVSTRKSNSQQLALSNNQQFAMSNNQQFALTITPQKSSPPMEPLISPITFYADQGQSPEHIYDDPDPEPVVMSSDSESEPEKIFSGRGSRFIPIQPEAYQNKSQQPYNSLNPSSRIPDNKPKSQQPHHSLASSSRSTSQQPHHSLASLSRSKSQQPHHSLASSSKIPDNKSRNEKRIQTSFQSPPLPNQPVKQKKSFKNDDEGSNGSKEGDNPWLFEAVKETLGPRGMSADMESLGERSRHSHKSHRSSKHRRKKGGSSVGSRGSKTSLKSYRSQVSIAQSEASKSVAMDLMRLENQLNSISKTDSTIGVSSVHSHTSKSTSASKRRTMRNFIKLHAPAGKLGVILANRTEKPGTVVSDVRPSSPLHGKIFPGDRIVSIDGENVSMIPVSEITSIMARKADFERVLTVLTCKNGLKM